MQRLARFIAATRAATKLHNHTKKTRKNCTDAAPDAAGGALRAIARASNVTTTARRAYDARTHK